jgi:hypothetical protein
MNIRFLDCVNSVISNCFVQIEQSCCNADAQIHIFISVQYHIFSQLGNTLHKNSGALDVLLPFSWYSVSKCRLLFLSYGVFPHFMQETY